MGCRRHLSEGLPASLFSDSVEPASSISPATILESLESAVSSQDTQKMHDDLQYLYSMLDCEIIDPIVFSGSKILASVFTEILSMNSLPDLKALVCSILVLLSANNVFIEVPPQLLTYLLLSPELNVVSSSLYCLSALASTGQNKRDLILRFLSMDGIQSLLSDHSCPILLRNAVIYFFKSISRFKLDKSTASSICYTLISSLQLIRLNITELHEHLEVLANVRMNYDDYVTLFYESGVYETISSIKFPADDKIYSFLLLIIGDLDLFQTNFDAIITLTEYSCSKNDILSANAFWALYKQYKESYPPHIQAKVAEAVFYQLKEGLSQSKVIAISLLSKLDLHNFPIDARHLSLLIIDVFPDYIESDETDSDVIHAIITVIHNLCCLFAHQSPNPVVECLEHSGAWEALHSRAFASQDMEKVESIGMFVNY